MRALNVSAGLIACCAAVITSAVVHREFFAPSAGDRASTDGAVFNADDLQRTAAAALAQCAAQLDTVTRH
jgi:hypothetical protein